jgi:hypothetical protein
VSAAAAGALSLFLLLCAATAFGISRRLHIWLLPWIRRRLRDRARPRGVIDIMICVADHYEPCFENVPYAQECRRVEEWVRRYPSMASRHCDSDGRMPQHTFFYPEEEYRPEHLDRIADLCRRGFGDVEIHLHHDGDTAESLRRKLDSFRHVLHYRHGLLHRNHRTGEIEYAFIHGNWALDNSDGGRNCGVDNELTVLRETGCYADMTLPSAPGPGQTRKVNSIYYAVEDGRPMSHDRGFDVRAGGTAGGDLMIVQGPLALNFGSRKWGMIPRVENGEVSGDNPPTPQRARLWVEQSIHVEGRPNWIFVKLHTHGANERNMEALLGRPMDETLSFLERTYNDYSRYRLHYVTARELYSIVRAAESGAEGNAGDFRNFVAAAVRAG